MSASMAEVIDLALGSFSIREDRVTLAAHVAEQLAANGYGKLEDAKADGWDLGYEIGIRDWPECAVACGACKECLEPAKTNPYRTKEN